MKVVSESSHRSVMLMRFRNEEVRGANSYRQIVDDGLLNCARDR